MGEGVTPRPDLRAPLPTRPRADHRRLSRGRDDACWDAARQRLYVVGGEGRVAVYEYVHGSGSSRAGASATWEQTADLGGTDSRGRCAWLGSCASALGARTGVWCAQRHRLHAAATGDSHEPVRGCLRSRPWIRFAAGLCLRVWGAWNSTECWGAAPDSDIGRTRPAVNKRQVLPEPLWDLDFLER